MSSSKSSPVQEINFYGINLKKLENDRFIVSGEAIPKGWNPNDPAMGFEVKLFFENMFTNKRESFQPVEVFNWILPMGKLDIQVTMTRTDQNGEYEEERVNKAIYYGGHSFVE